MGIKVIGHYLSSPVLRVLFTLEALGLEYEYEQITGLEYIKSPEYLATKNPFGKIPVIIDDGFTLYESRAICRYLVNKYQGTKNSTILIPKDIQKAALVEQYLSVENLYFEISSTAINYEEVINKYHGKEANAEKVKESKEKIEQTLDIYEKLLEGKDYLIGEFSLADLSHVPNLYINIHKNSIKDIYYDAKRPNVVRWVKNLLEIPAWKQINNVTCENGLAALDFDANISGEDQSALRILYTLTSYMMIDYSTFRGKQNANLLINQFII
nr:6286_t:CDS:2 [Entrophospora candida]